VLRIVLWAAILQAADRPWRELGGLLSERMRWLERIVLGGALVAGWVAGLPPPDDAPRQPRSMLLRRIPWLAPGAVVALALVVLEICGLWKWVLLLFAGWLAYWAGLDLAGGAWPLLRPGREEGEDTRA